MTLSPDFAIGTFVFHRAGGSGSDRGVVTGYIVREASLHYLVTWGDRVERGHFGSELDDHPYYGTPSDH